MKPFRNLGCYGILNPQADFDKCADDVKKAGFGGMSVFINADRWTQPPDPKAAIFPWPYDPVLGLWDMSSKNQAYYDMVRAFTSACFSRSLDIHLKFHTQYHLRSWNKFPAMKQKNHPYFLNNFKFDAGQQLKDIYDSITFPVMYHWLQWTDINESHNKFLFKPANTFGQAIMTWMMTTIHQIASDFRIARAGTSRSRLSFAANNEEIAQVVGDRSEIFVWIREQWVNEGLTPAAGTPFVSVVNRQAQTGNPNWAKVNKELFDGITRLYGVNFGLGSLMEIHVDGADDAQRFVNIGCNKSRLFMSNDGTPKDPKTFLSESKKFWNYGGNDFIYDEGVFNPNPAPPFKWMANWKASFPGHAQIPQ